MKTLPLPPPWFQTTREFADELGVSTDRVLYYMDSGLLAPPGVKVPKATLPGIYAGPAPYVIALLDRYRDMQWEPAEDDRIALLDGEVRGYAVDGPGFTNLKLTECGVYVRRSDLVVPITAREEFETALAISRPLRSDERRTLLLILAALSGRVLPDVGGHPYALAERMSVDLSCVGIELGRQAIANKIKEALALLPGSAQVAA